MQDIYQHQLVILDADSPYTQIVARHIRQLGVYCEVMPANTPSQEVLANKPKGLVITSLEGNACPAELSTVGLPILEIPVAVAADSDQLLPLLNKFLFTDCACTALWQSPAIIDTMVANIRQQVGTQKVLLGLSGGVDSSVVAALLHKAIGAQLTCVFVDHGLLRKNEGDLVMEMFAKNMGVKVIRVAAGPLFLERLQGVSDPEAKRKIIGSTFIDVFEEQAKQLTDINFLAQGTIYPDVIESLAIKNGQKRVVKSHHNVGGLPASMRMQLVEPLRQLFKDEVRRIGVELGLPEDMIYRHPFPGPGLGVRILGEIKQEYADILREADAIFIEELRAAGWYHKTSQAFAVFLPIKSVGLVEDERRYEWVIALRAVETIDFMTARWAHLPYDLLEKVSARIITEIPQVSRVTYDISSKPPATIEWE